MFHSWFEQMVESSGFRLRDWLCFECCVTKESVVMKEIWEKLNAATYRFNENVALNLIGFSKKNLVLATCQTYAFPINDAIRKCSVCFCLTKERCSGAENILCCHQRSSFRVTEFLNAEPKNANVKYECVCDKQLYDNLHSSLCANAYLQSYTSSHEYACICCSILRFGSRNTVCSDSEMRQVVLWALLYIM